MSGVVSSSIHDHGRPCPLHHHAWNVTRPTKVIADRVFKNQVRVQNGPRGSILDSAAVCG
ncbi:hypothetical protein GS4_08_01740 [Gordonia soli NBRC 108243]|uniref:Uncharacterized protein n=1 Tax=Gordonia soli NBRC 108243 TaxID=1223545 RepID=M0QGL5_9ACTN|nr:hypothetical protein GS4_08_01740 [Gordonia soli NBRC 108243]